MTVEAPGIPRPSGLRGGAIKVVSYNISFAEHIDLAIQELGEFEDADVILLQEMDEAGTELVAKSLKYDYVY